MSFQNWYTFVMEEIPSRLEQISSKERLQELEATGNFLFHGSPFQVATFEPRQAYTDDDGGQPTPDGEPAVFASAEIETPIYRSIFHENSFESLEGSYEIGFSNSDDGSHYIHANEAAVAVCKENTGYVYVFKRDDFVLRGNSEWFATKKVRPVAVFYSSFDDVGLPIQSSRPKANQENRSENISHPKIASEIKQMVDVDQTMRERWEENPIIPDEDLDIDVRHTERMKEIVSEIGWPTISKVGVEGASNAWLLVQHADHDVAFQEQCLNLMKEAPVGELDKTDTAYLEDRVRVNQGRGQLYGTQFTQENSQHIPRPIEDEENVDERRAELGMGPLSEQIAHMYNKYPFKEED